MPKIPFWVFIILAVLYFTAIRVDTMDVDASQYAEMSREMKQSGDYLHLYDRGHDYLDKPPFLFWASATSMRVFGDTNFGFKLPSILFALLALFATYRLTRLLYNEDTARIAALVLGTSQGLFLMTNDVRCDTILMSWVILAIWLIKEWQENKKLYYLLLGAACVAGGMMTKGPIALMVPAFCFISDWVLKRQWKMFIRPQYLLAIVVIGILLIPMSIGLYQQFDLHPEKLIDGKYHTSGLRFFYWSQSFGRITGESPWSNGAGFDFLMSSMLWAYLPWILLFLTGFITNVVRLVKQKIRLAYNEEWLSTGGFILTYCSLASSHYQLPHYIFVAFPLASIVTGKYLYDLMNGRYPKMYRILKPTQTTISALLLVGALLTLTFVFPARPLVIVAWVGSAALWLYLAVSKKVTGKLVWISASAIMLANIFLTNHFYHSLLEYEVGAKVGRYIDYRNIPANKILSYRMQDELDALPFYARRVIAKSDTPMVKLPAVQYVLTMDSGINDLHEKGYSFDTVKRSVLFKVSQLTPEFLNPATRSTAVHNYYFLRMK
ncbi:MAG: glycosyltransferase family 39 protein [Taibaiella sp.]|nr:glycosyltransferase family 39 protein [Taibaiella sp.]